MTPEEEKRIYRENMCVRSRNRNPKKYSNSSIDLNINHLNEVENLFDDDENWADVLRVKCTENL